MLVWQVYVLPLIEINGLVTGCGCAIRQISGTSFQLAMQWDASSADGSMPTSTSAPEQATANVHAVGEADADMNGEGTVATDGATETAEASKMLQEVPELDKQEKAKQNVQ